MEYLGVVASWTAVGVVTGNHFWHSSVHYERNGEVPSIDMIQ